MRLRKFGIALAMALALFVSRPAQAVSINSRGQVTGCVAGGVAHIDGKVISLPAGGCNWVDDDTIIYQACEAEHCVVQTYNQVTGEKKTAWNGGAIEVTAGGGVWACFCGAGVQTSTGATYAGSSLSMNQSGEDGTFVMKVVYQAWGPYDGVEPSGARWRLTEGTVGLVVSDVQLLGARRATWLEGAPRNNFGANIKWLGGWWLRSAFINGQLWVMYQNVQTSRLFLHPADSFIGYEVGTDTLTYEPAIRVLPNGAVRVAWSTDPSETPNGTKAVTVDMSAPRVDLAKLITPTAPPPVVVVPSTPPPPAPLELQAPNKQDVVAQVQRDHPEIDSCDENSLDKGRAAIVDWAAQRLNKAEGRVVWGRKSRGKPNGNTAVNPNTDGLTFLRSDGLFEIYDVISGAPPCRASWSDASPTKPGENGFWAPPQLGPEGSAGGGGTTDPRIAELEKKLADLKAEFVRVHTAEWQQISDLQARQRELEAERDDLKGQLAATQQERDAALNHPPATCTARVETSWARSLGARASCQVK